MCFFAPFSGACKRIRASGSCVRVPAAGADRSGNVQLHERTGGGHRKSSRLYLRDPPTALLAPEIIHAILAGTWQRSVPLEKLRKQRDADPQGGQEEALLDGGKAGSSMMIDGEGKIHIMFFMMADCGLLFAS